MNDESRSGSSRSVQPERAGALIIAGVVTSLVSVGIAIADLTRFLAGGGYALIVASVGLGLLGAGFARLATDPSAPFGRAFARRGLRTLAIGLLLDAAIAGILSTGALVGPLVDILILPLIIAGWMTVIGLGLTVLALLLSSGPSAMVGWVFVAAFAAIAASNSFTNVITDNAIYRAIGLVLGAVAACGLAAGFAGVGIISIRLRPPRSE